VKVNRALTGAALLLAVYCAPAVVQEKPSTGLEEEPALIQVFLGVLKLDDETGEWDEISDDNVDVDFSSLPSGGIEAEYPFYRGFVHWGLNPGGSIAWKSDDTSFSGRVGGDTGGTLRVDIDNSLFLAELHLGGYVRGRLSERITTYAAAGPMVVYGYHEVEDESLEDVDGSPVEGDVELSETDSSDINLGFYGRAGVDFEIRDNQHLGFGVRYLSSELDFNKTVGKLDVEGPQYVLTYSARF
jgi:opacity protein-like surface antigen